MASDTPGRGYCSKPNPKQETCGRAPSDKALVRESTTFNLTVGGWCGNRLIFAVTIGYRITIGVSSTIVGRHSSQRIEDEHWSAVRGGLLSEWPQQRSLRPQAFTSCMGAKVWRRSNAMEREPRACCHRSLRHRWRANIRCSAPSTRYCPFDLCYFARPRTDTIFRYTDLREEFRKLNKQLLFHFIDLVHNLTKGPKQQIEQVCPNTSNNLSQSVHASGDITSLELVFELARATLQRILEEQVTRKKEALENVRARRRKTKEIFEEAVASLCALVSAPPGHRHIDATYHLCTTSPRTFFFCRTALKHIAARGLERQLSATIPGVGTSEAAPTPVSNASTETATALASRTINEPTAVAPPASCSGVMNSQDSASRPSQLCESLSSSHKKLQHSISLALDLFDDDNPDNPLKGAFSSKSDLMELDDK
eukprot:1186195-Prorocentrum_minimum.AAC.5